MTGTLSTTAERLYLSMKELPIVSPHGHCDPSWFAQNQPFANPAALLVTPDHYVFRMLYAQGIPMADLGIGAPGAEADPREVFRLFAAHWHLFLGTPTRLWMEYVLRETLQISQPLTAQTADAIYDDISERLQQAEFLPVHCLSALTLKPSPPPTRPWMIWRTTRAFAPAIGPVG